MPISSQIEKLFDISCCLVDVISYVPFERVGLEYGPREYLHQIILLISNLRGGQQRYMPLLMSKINDTMPSAPGYALTSVTSNQSHDTDIYGGSEQTKSMASSTASSPFGTPPLSALSEQQSQPFSPFPSDFEPGLDVASGIFTPVAMVTTSMDFSSLPVSASQQAFADPSMFDGFQVDTKYDSDG